MGRVSIYLKPSCGKVPIDNAMMSVSFIKDIINSVDKEYCERIFNFNGRSNKRIKDINTSFYIPNYVVKSNELQVENEIIFNIGFFREEMFYYIYNGSLKLKELEYKNYKFIIKKVDIKIEHEIKEDGVIFKTKSPIIIRNRDGRYMNISDEDYEENLNYIANVILENIRGTGLARRLQFIPINLKKRVLKEKIRNFDKRDFYYINAYTGTFFLKGDKDDLNALYKTGLGYRRVQNAGMLDILK